MTPCRKPAQVAEGVAARRPARAARGFTLIELLLAVLIFAVILLSIHLVFAGALRLRNRTTQAIEASLPLEVALNVIRRDLSHVVVPGGTLSGQLQTTLTTKQQQSSSLAGRTVSPAFYTAVGYVDGASPFSEIEKVMYILATPTNQTTGLDLYRSVTRNLLPVLAEDAEPQWLLGGIENVTFQYLSGTQWTDSWDSSSGTNSLPAAIQMEIQFAAEPGELNRRLPVRLVVPVLVQGSSTNQTSSGSTSGT